MGEGAGRGTPPRSWRGSSLLSHPSRHLQIEVPLVIWCQRPFEKIRQAELHRPLEELCFWSQGSLGVTFRCSLTQSCYLPAWIFGSPHTPAPRLQLCCLRSSLEMSMGRQGPPAIQYRLTGPPWPAHVHFVGFLLLLFFCWFVFCFFFQRGQQCGGQGNF